MGKTFMDQYTLVAISQSEKSRMTQLKNKYGDNTLEYLLQRERDAIRLEKEREILETNNKNSELQQKEAIFQSCSSIISSLVSTSAQMSKDIQYLLSIKIPNAIEYDEIIANKRSELKKALEEKFEVERFLKEKSDELNTFKEFYRLSQDELETAKKQCEFLQGKIAELERTNEMFNEELKEKKMAIKTFLSHQNEFKKYTSIIKDYSIAHNDIDHNEN